MEIHWLVLTGGAGSRLGQDKASTSIEGSTLIERALNILEVVDPASSVSVVGPERSGGPAAAVVSMLPECNAGFIGVFAVDMPLAGAAIKELMVTASESASESTATAAGWVPVDENGRRQWLCALYRREALRDAASGQEWMGRGFYELVGSLPTVEVEVSAGASLIDVDTPADLQRARELIRANLEASDG